VHTDAGINAIVESIQINGWTNPVLLQKGTNRILAGHGRRLAALKLGLKEIPAIYLEQDDIRASAYTITDNATTERSSWDYDLLRAELAELMSNGIDLATVGFSESFMQSMMPHVEAVEGKEFDESIAEGVTLDVTYKLKVGLAESESFESALDQFLADHPGVKMEKVV
jgi:hypothetical protein